MPANVLIVGSNPELLFQVDNLVRGLGCESKPIVFNQQYVNTLPAYIVPGCIVPNTSTFYPAFSTLKEMIEEVDNAYNQVIWWDKILLIVDGNFKYNMDLVHLYNQSDCVKRPKSVLVLTSEIGIMLRGNPTYFEHTARLSEQRYQQLFLEEFSNLEIY